MSLFFPADRKRGQRLTAQRKLRPEPAGGTPQRLRQSIFSPVIFLRVKLPPSPAHRLKSEIRLPKEGVCEPRPFHLALTNQDKRQISVRSGLLLAGSTEVT